MGVGACVFTYVGACMFTCVCVHMCVIYVAMYRDMCAYFCVCMCIVVLFIPKPLVSDCALMIISMKMQKRYSEKLYG